jgi:1,2-diacylglycerol 3-alpha-glucosyltransferase
MKVLFITPRYSPAIGGVETHVSQVVAHLKQSHTLKIITEAHTPDLKSFEEIDGVPVWRVPYSGIKTKKRKLWLWLLKHWLLLFRADVIHVHDVFFWLLPFRVLFFWKAIYITFHGYEAPGPLKWKQIWWHRLAAVLTQANICVGDFHKKWYHIDPDAITYGGVSEETLQVKRKKKSKNEVTAVFVGRLATDTGLMSYLHALTRLKESKKVVTLEVYGDGPLSLLAEEYVKTQKLNVRFHGFVKDVSKVYEHADVAFASQYLAILQNLAKGIPVIAYADTPIKTDYLEITPFAHWITIAKHPNDIAQAVEELEPASSFAIEWAQQQTWTKVGQLYEKIWTA